MTIDEVANFAEFKDCTVSLGSSEVGFIQIDGTGVMSKFNNYRRFLAHNELASLPDRRKVLQNATTFRITRGTEIRELSREEFQSELDQFQQKLGI